MEIKNISLEEIKRRIDSLKDNATSSELLMKAKLDFKKIKYEFQYPIDTKTSYFIVDFYFPKSKTIIEIDGSVHRTKEQIEKDKSRDILLKIKGYKVVRIWNWNVDTYNTERFILIKKVKTTQKQSRSKKLDAIAKKKEQEIYAKKKADLVQRKMKEINDKKYPYLK